MAGVNPLVALTLTIADLLAQHPVVLQDVEYVVADPERVLALAGVALLLHPPGALRRARDRARPERVEALAEPAAGGVLGGGDADVVAAVVLDVEVAVEALRQGDLGQPALVGLLLVAEPWAVLMPMPPIAPIEIARPTLSIVSSGSIPNHSVLASQTKAPTKPTYWIGRKR